jgi:benzil reductase ((S)-benzoin forming)
MNYFFITGTSRGIGKALCNRLLENSSNKVIGISRSQTIFHPNYKHIDFDLSGTAKLSDISGKFFDIEGTVDKVVLVNNAGILGEVGYFGNISDNSLTTLYNVNVIAPALLMNHFIKKFKDFSIEKIIINISSGAGSRPMDGWGGYCSSKAAINMMSEVAALENKIRNNKFNIYALAPGVVDTEMQGEIRKVDNEDFSELDRFIKMKKNNELSDPDATAKKIIYLINNAHKYSVVVQDVRKF